MCITNNLNQKQLAQIRETEKCIIADEATKHQQEIEVHVTIMINIISNAEYRNCSKSLKLVQEKKKNLKKSHDIIEGVNNMSSA